MWHHGAKVDWVSLGGRRTSIYIHVWYYGHIMIRKNGHLNMIMTFPAYDLTFT